MTGVLCTVCGAQVYFVWCLLGQRNGGLKSGQKLANIVTDALRYWHIVIDITRYKNTCLSFFRYKQDFLIVL